MSEQKFEWGIGGRNVTKSSTVCRTPFGPRQLWGPEVKTVGSGSIRRLRGDKQKTEVDTEDGFDFGLRITKPFTEVPLQDV